MSAPSRPVAKRFQLSISRLLVGVALAALDAAVARHAVEIWRRSGTEGLRYFVGHTTMPIFLLIPNVSFLTTLCRKGSPEPGGD